MLQRVVFTRDVSQGLLEYARAQHPREGILLLRGRVKSSQVHIVELVLPPEPVHGLDFSSFNPYLLPLDVSIVGVAHSHPSGAPQPSDEDLLNFYGCVAVIVAYPYQSEHDVAAYDAEGRKLACIVK